MCVVYMKNSSILGIYKCQHTIIGIAVLTAVKVCTPTKLILLWVLMWLLINENMSTNKWLFYFSLLASETLIICASAKSVYRPLSKSGRNISNLHSMKIWIGYWSLYGTDSRKAKRFQNLHILQYNRNLKHNLCVIISNRGLPRYLCAKVSY